MLEITEADTFITLYINEKEIGKGKMKLLDIDLIFQMN